MVKVRVNASFVLARIGLLLDAGSQATLVTRALVNQNSLHTMPKGERTIMMEVNDGKMLNRCCWMLDNSVNLVL